MNFGELFEQHLSSQANAIIKNVSQIAAELNLSVYLVGGAVRDVLLSRSSTDLDFVTEGSGIQLAQAVHAQLGGEVTPHERFGTAVWTPPADLFSETIDFITARKEGYPHPAALPDVTPSTMKDDLFRRDFTINAIAVPLIEDQTGELLDLYGGRSDLEHKLIRILHPESFADDPTRILRATRYAGRLSFPIEEKTLQAMQSDLDKIDLLSADRLRHEFEHIFEELDPRPILVLLKNLGILTEISEQIGWNKAHQIAFDKLDVLMADELGSAALEQSGIVHLRLLAWICATPQPRQAAAELEKKLNFSGDLRQDLKNILEFLNPENTLAVDAKPGSIEKAFRHLNASQLTILQTVNILPPQIREFIPTYFSEWRHIKPFSDGNTLRQMGLPPGPIYKTILNALIAAKLNGEITTKQDEIELIKEMG